MKCLFFKENNWNFFHVVFQPVHTSSFELDLVCILYIVIGSDVPLACSYQSKDIQGYLKYSECKYETISWDSCAHNPGFQTPNLLVF